MMKPPSIQARMMLVIFMLGLLLLIVAKWCGNQTQREHHLRDLTEDAVEMAGRLAGMSQHLLRQGHRRAVELEMSYASLHSDLEVAVVLGPEDRVLHASQLALRNQPLEIPELAAFQNVVRVARAENDLSLDWNALPGRLLVAAPFYPGFNNRDLGAVALSFDEGRAWESALHASRRGLVLQAGVLAACCLLLWAAMDVMLAGRLRSVLRMARDFGKGVIVQPPLEGDDELGQISKSFHEAIHEARTVESRLVEAAETERQRIGRDIHDDVCQRIAAAQLRAGVLHSVLNREQNEHATLARDVAEELELAANVARGLSRGLTPAVAGSLDLVDALNKLSLDVQRSFGPEVGVDVGELPEVFSTGQWTHLYRVIQELTTNAAKHSGATSIDIRVRSGDGVLVIELESDGKPFDGKPSGTSGIGFEFALQRIRALSGRVQFTPRKQGSLVVCEIPIGAGCVIDHPPL